MQENKSSIPTQPYEPMLNLFAAYAEEEKGEEQAVQRKPASRVSATSRKRKVASRRCSTSFRRKTCMTKPPYRKM